MYSTVNCVAKKKVLLTNLPNALFVVILIFASTIIFRLGGFLVTFNSLIIFFGLRMATFRFFFTPRFRIAVDQLLGCIYDFLSVVACPLFCSVPKKPDKDDEAKDHCPMNFLRIGYCSTVSN